MITRRALLASPALLAQTGFRWPNGKRCAVSLTWDDARLSQIDAGIPFLNRHGVKGTFYILPRNWEKRMDGWKGALRDGHELAHHSMTHPCSINFGFTAKNGLEEYTFEKLESDLDAATAEFRKSFGVTPKSFAYPCGQKYVGRGVATRSYVPAVAKRFLTGRGYLDEASNNPAVCDLANLMGTGFDNAGWPEMKRHIDVASKEGRWLIFAGHEMGKTGNQTTNLEALGELIAFAKDPANGIWLDTVAAVASFVAKAR
ncbi:MAG: polysaccharide deacetylase [Acidobacteria bacterium]|nr:polysaccharide deacetylase [Acidobacteriota bacterium]